MAVLADRETLRDQLAEAPADGDPNAVAISIARVGDTAAWSDASHAVACRLRRMRGAMPLALAQLARLAAPCPLFHHHLPLAA